MSKSCIRLQYCFFSSAPVLVDQNKNKMPDGFAARAGSAVWVQRWKKQPKSAILERFGLGKPDQYYVIAQSRPATDADSGLPEVTRGFHIAFRLTGGKWFAVERILHHRTAAEITVLVAPPHWALELSRQHPEAVEFVLGEDGGFCRDSNGETIG